MWRNPQGAVTVSHRPLRQDRPSPNNSPNCALAADPQVADRKTPAAKIPFNLHIVPNFLPRA